MTAAGSRRPDDTPFKQQTLKAWRPILTPRKIIVMFAVVGLVFVPIGAVIIAYSNDVVEVTSDDYDGACCMANCSSSMPTWQRIDQNPCNISITVEDRMEPPIYVYYKLTNYYQNHRRYVRSRDDKQLKGQPIDGGTLAESDSCQYHVYNVPPGGSPSGDPAEVINPCGLIAWSVFNDTFAMFSPGGAEVALDETSIAWPSDVENKFRNNGVNGNGSTGQNFPQFTFERSQTCAALEDTGEDCGGISCFQRCNEFAAAAPGNPAGLCFPGSKRCVEDEHFIVWMRAAGLPQFRKLWARILEPLEPGQYSIRVTNGRPVASAGSQVTYLNDATGEEQRFLYPVASFEGSKSIVLSTTSWIGGKNFFLGYAYVVVGVVCIVLAICFLVKYRLSPRDLGSASYITWAKDK